MKNEILYNSHRTIRWNETQTHLTQACGGYLLVVNSRISAILTEPLKQIQMDSYRVTRIEGNLKWVDKDDRFGKYISSSQKLVDGTCPTDDWYVSMEYPIPYISVEEIENEREDSPRFIIGILMEIIGADQRLLLNGDIEFTIPVDKWLKDLDRVGFKHCTLFEIPSIEIQGDPLIELKKAYRFFSLGEYDDAVAHCRTAVDSIENYPQLKLSLEKSINSISIADQYMKLLKAEKDMLKVAIDATMRISSRTHHTVTVGHFNKVISQEILTMTTVFVARLARAASTITTDDAE